MAQPDAPLPKGEVTELLDQWRSGRPEAFEELLPHVYKEMRALAANRLRGERQGHTLQTTALVHEAYLRMVGKSRAKIKNRSHFFAVAAQAMRRVLIDYARKSKAAKRGSGATHVEFESGEVEARSDEVLAVDFALEKLARLDERQAKVVELRYFGGLTASESAEVLGVSEATVNREWRAAKLWLRRELSTENGP